MLPTRYRKIENLHIAFWLVKDICWVSDFKVAGIGMIVPTLGVAVWITWKLRDTWSELSHNLAVTCWICANSVWMIGEFYFQDSTRPLAKIFFIAGILVLAVFYGRLLISKITGRFVSIEKDQTLD